MNHLTVHLALDPQNETNGCLQYVPGSHRWDRGDGVPLPVTDFNFKARVYWYLSFSPAFIQCTYYTCIGHGLYQVSVEP